MATNSRTRITVQAIVKAPVEKVWKYWNEPEHITHWSFASNDWHAPSATNDLRPGGKLIVRMEAKDGSAGFDFGGTYDVGRRPHYSADRCDSSTCLSTVSAFAARGHPA